VARAAAAAASAATLLPAASSSGKRRVAHGLSPRAKHHVPSLGASERAAERVRHSIADCDQVAEPRAGEGDGDGRVLACRAAQLAVESEKGRGAAVAQPSVCSS
jgi:hypothetical protein